MSGTTPNPNDPSGLVSNPPTTIVKIQGTAREDINGLLGIVVQFQTDRGRYLVLLTSTQNVVSMKPENLVKANYMEQVQAQYQQVCKDPQIQRLLTQVSNRLPPGITLQQVGMGLGVLVVALIYFLGFSRTLMLFSFIMLGLMMIGPDLVAGANTQTILQNAPMRFKTMVRDQFPGGSYIADKPYALAGVAIFMVAFFVKSMMPVGGSSKAAAAAASGAGSATNLPQPRRQLSQSTIEEYYKLGFDDATAQKEFGASLADALKHSPNEDAAAMFEDVDLGVPDYPMPPTTGGGGGIMSKLFSLSSAMSIMYLGRTAMELGRDANGSWQFDLFKANLTTLEPWKLGLLGLSLFRLVSTLMGR